MNSSVGEEAVPFLLRTAFVSSNPIAYDFTHAQSISLSNNLCFSKGLCAIMVRQQDTQRGKFIVIPLSEKNKTQCFPLKTGLPAQVNNKNYELTHSFHDPLSDHVAF